MRTAFADFLTFRHTLAIALLALVATASYVLLIWAIETERANLRVVHMARQQAADTATALYLAHLTVYGPPGQSERYRDKLADAIDRIDERDIILSLENGAEDIATEMKAVLKDIYHGQQNVDQQMANFIRLARQILEAGGGATELKELARLHISLFPAHLRLTDLLRAEATEAVDKIKLLATSLWLLTLLVLAGTGLLIFRPTARRAAAMLADMRDARNQACKEAAAASAAREAQTRFIRTMNHELRTPLNVILGMTHLLSLRPPQPKAEEYVQDIQRAGQHLLVLINNLLNLSRLDAGEVTLNETPTALDRLVENTAALLRPLAEEKSLELSVGCDETLQGPYLADNILIQQILLNLIGNAIKFTEAGRVTVRAHFAGVAAEGQDRIRFEVADTGIGIAANERHAVFEEFRQADSARVHEYEGTGLGLTISKRLVALMGGEMGVQSEEGQGSLFWFTLVLERVPVPMTVAGNVANSQSMPDM